MNDKELQGAKILVVDDTPANLDVLCDLLEGRGYDILMAPSGSIALKVALKTLPDLIMMDVNMPEMDGYEACRRLKGMEETQDIPVIFVTARDMETDVVNGFQAGGVDYITKPFMDEEVLVRVETHVRLNRLTRELVTKNEALEEEIAQRKVLKGQLSMMSQREADQWGLDGFVGESVTMKQVFKDIRLMQENVATSVLITGESGTGKELIARAIHFGSQRKDAPFVPVNCNAIPAELVESVLFGHVRGAFTGANEDRIGYFELAQGGTLFLDEIGDMPLELQGKLLRVLEDGEVWPVGANKGRQVEVRVLAASNADLNAKIQNGNFRQDLFYRLARFTVVTPPLRKRKEDVPLLARHFLHLFAKEMGREVPELSQETVEMLKAFDFPGNVRELKNTIERALIESGGSDISPGHLHFVSSGSAEFTAPSAMPALNNMPMDLKKAAQYAEKLVAEETMRQVDGNISEAARSLGISRNTLYRILNFRETT